MSEGKLYKDDTSVLVAETRLENEENMSKQY